MKEPEKCKLIANRGFHFLLMPNGVKIPRQTFSSITQRCSIGDTIAIIEAHVLKSWYPEDPELCKWSGSSISFKGVDIPGQFNAMFFEGNYFDVVRFSVPCEIIDSIEQI